MQFWAEIEMGITKKEHIAETLPPPPDHHIVRCKPLLIVTFAKERSPVNILNLASELEKRRSKFHVPVLHAL